MMRLCQVVPNLSVSRPSASVCLFLSLGQCDTPLGSRPSPTLVPSLARLPLSPNDPCLLQVLSQYSSILPALESLSISPSAFLSLSSHPHALSYFSSYPHPHSVFIFWRTFMSMKPSMCASAPFSVRRKPTFFPRALPCPPPLPYLAYTDSGFGFVLLIFF